MSEGCIYFIQAGHECGPVKIGWSRNPESRLRNLQTGQHETLTLLAALPAKRGQERAMHFMLGRHHIRGEWFEWCLPIERTVEASIGASDMDEVWTRLARASMAAEVSP